MERILLRAKIHRARVTDADLQYEGSITIDRTLMEAADLYPFEQVHIYNCTNGNRFSTYAIEGEPGSGVICLNGAAARQVSRDDIVIIAAYAQMKEEEARNHQPRLVYVDGENRIKEVKNRKVA